MSSLVLCNVVLGSIWWLQRDNLLEYTPRYQRFLLREREYSHQYSHVYTARTASLRYSVRQNARRIWNDIGMFPLQLRDSNISYFNLQLGVVNG